GRRCWTCWGVESRQTKAIPTARQNTRPAVRRAGVHIFDVLFRGRRFRLDAVPGLGQLLIGLALSVPRRGLAEELPPPPQPRPRTSDMFFARKGFLEKTGSSRERAHPLPRRISPPQRRKNCDPFLARACTWP